MFDWFENESALIVLFFSGVLSATLLPGASEATFVATLKLEFFSMGLVVLTATLGNTLGAIINYFLGKLLSKIKMTNKYNAKAHQWLKKHGYWALLFSWLPIIGDPLTLVAGWLRMNLGLCVLLIAIGKAARYLLLALIFPI